MREFAQACQNPGQSGRRIPFLLRGQVDVKRADQLLKSRVEVGDTLTLQGPTPSRVVACIGMGILHRKSGLADTAQSVEGGDHPHAAHGEGFAQAANLLMPPDEVLVVAGDQPDRSLGSLGHIEAVGD